MQETHSHFQVMQTQIRQLIALKLLITFISIVCKWEACCEHILEPELSTTSGFSLFALTFGGSNKKY
jgi:hypothetical protein